jgi:hypothetical protein
VENSLDINTLNRSFASPINRSKHTKRTFTMSASRNPDGPGENTEFSSRRDRDEPLMTGGVSDIHLRFDRSTTLVTSF